MPLPPPQTPHWRHVYRALLRESDYLPDPIARQYMSSHVRESYRAYWPRVIPNSYTGPNGQFYLERRARKLLSILSRANEGYMKPLERVLMLSYGRIGRRRHVLARPFFVPNSSGDKTPFRFILPPTCPPSWEPIPSLSALMKSQMENRHLSNIDATPVIREIPQPKKSIWNGHVSKRKVQKATEKWYNMVIKSVLPPIPDQEWNTLHGLVAGKEPWSLPKRRKRLDTNHKRSDLDAEFLVFGPQKDRTFEAYVHGRPHKITRKLMTPMWERVLLATPRMTQIPETKDWIVRWGEPVVSPIFRTLDPELGINSLLFDGVDRINGALLKPKEPQT
ncbi:hypothetical protein I7I51_03276 [Histoplasma capsulatum]|uniref:LYR motif-containing protein Cup1-like N-terminal domain-containing protein n=1 Tax=Ajellomyces capsulatus TaxID=5037 RepID=A0A8A1M909_AJECA|nr:predicted protein [Histoplasma mississippiense (nom. inval.)]EDN07456.1 predicted protein [Histoplasma mississippiense (nom. inval.)]QSS61104.1 hypothetical protein I7I51_03276 [Histoplasma capsulatum]